jgi:hypothetical protein
VKIFLKYFLTLFGQSSFLLFFVICIFLKLLIVPGKKIILKFQSFSKNGVLGGGGGAFKEMLFSHERL